MATQSHSTTADIAAGSQVEAKPANGRADDAGGAWRAWMVFAREFVRSPRLLGTCLPCSGALGRVMLGSVPLQEGGVVVEFGTGIGSVSRAILRDLPPGCRYLGIEQNAALAAVCRSRLKRADVQTGDAADVEQICESRGIRGGDRVGGGGGSGGNGGVDLIVSGLPLLLFSNDTRRRILTAASRVLRPGGVFAQVSYGADVLPVSRRVRAVMADHFSVVRPSRMVWWNVPPAFVYQCVRKGQVKWTVGRWDIEKHRSVPRAICAPIGPSPTPGVVHGCGKRTLSPNVFRRP